MSSKTHHAICIVMGLGFSATTALAATPNQKPFGDSYTNPCVDDDPTCIRIGSDEKMHQSGYLLSDLENFPDRSAPIFKSLYGTYDGPQTLVSFSISLKEKLPNNREVEKNRSSITERIGNTIDQHPDEMQLLTNKAFISEAYQTKNAQGKIQTVLVPMTETGGTVFGFYIFGNQKHPMIAVSIQILETTLTPFNVTSRSHIDLPNRKATFYRFAMPIDPSNKNARTTFTSHGKTYTLSLDQASFKPDSSIPL